MAAQLRPNRLDVTDRFPMLGFTIRTDSPPRVAEVVLATDPALFTKKEGRTSSNFYSSREHGLLNVSRGEAVYVVPPEVLSRFIAADRLWFGLATASPPTGTDWTVDLMPTASSPYVSLSGLSDRALRRVRMFPTRVTSAYTRGPKAVVEWAGDRAQPGTSPAAPAGAPAAAPTATTPTTTPALKPADVPYDDGFGPLPPLNTGSQPATAPAAPAPATPPAAVSAGLGQARGLDDDSEGNGIDGPVFELDPPAPQSFSLAARARALTTAEYTGAIVMASPAYNDGRRGTTIDRIVIHITGAPQSPYIGSHFTRDDADSSAHYMVDQTGVIRQFVREQDTAWHAGNSAANRRSIGIEHVAIQHGGARYPRKDGSVQTFPYTPPTDVELNASAQLVASLCRKYGLTPNRETIIGHREANPKTGHSECPDGAWDWDGYMALVTAACDALPAAAQGLGYAHALEVDPDQMGIDGPVFDEEPSATQAMAFADPAKPRPRALKTAEYPGAKVMPSPAYSSRHKTKIDRIVIHITDAGQTRGLGAVFTDEKAKTSAHYMVDQNGLIRQFVREQDQAWHANNANRRSIGIEHVAVQRGGTRYLNRDKKTYTEYPYTPPTQIELETSAKLVASLCRKYGLTPDRTTIVGHHEIDHATSHSDCPDGAWDWDAYMPLVAAAYAALPAAAQGLGQGQSRAFDYDPDEMGIVEPEYTEGDATAQASALSLTAADYDRVGRLEPTNNFTAGRNGKAIDRIVIHITDGGTTAGAIAWFKKDQKKKSVSSHYIVGQDGEIVQMVAEADTAWHAHTVNSRSIGVEHVAVKRGGAHYASGDIPEMMPTDIQYSESAALVAHLCEKYGLPKDRTTIVGHHDVDASTSHANCPDGAWDWDHYMHCVTSGTSAPQTSSGQSFGQADARAMSADIPLDPGVGGMSIGMDALQIGDIIVSTTNENVSRAIRAASGSMVSHAMLYVGQGGQVIEAVGDGVRLVPLADALSHSVLAVALRVPGLNSDQRQLVADAACRYVGQPYNYLGVLRAGAFRMDSALCSLLPNGAGERCRAFSGQVDLGPGGNERLFCSQLVLQAFEDNGKQLTTDPAHAVAPGDIGNLQLRDGVLAYVGHLKAERPTSFFGVSLGTMTAARGLGVSRALDASDWSVNWDDVQLVPQPTGMGCWATAAAIILGWKNFQSVSPSLLASCNGMSKQMEDGLVPADVQAFAKAVGLVPHPNACYTAEGFRDILVAKGPVWVNARMNAQGTPFFHAIVVTGMYQRDGQAYVRITDPMDRVIGTPGSPGARTLPMTHTTGSRYIMTYEAFTGEFEAGAAVDMVQLAHAGGTFGHTINRGSAAGAGYALSLGDGVGNASLGTGTSLTRQSNGKNGRTYDLAQLSGMVMPDNALAGGAGMPAMPGERVVLDDWPYIEGPSGRTQAGIAIDWKFQGGAVGDISIVPTDGQVLDGWSASVRADIARNGSTPERVGLKVCVTTTFSRSGEEDQVAVTEVSLSGDGRTQTRHGADRAPVDPIGSSPPSAPAPAPQLQTA